MKLDVDLSRAESLGLATSAIRGLLHAIKNADDCLATGKAALAREYVRAALAEAERVNGQLRADEVARGAEISRRLDAMRMPVEHAAARVGAALERARTP